MDKKKEIKVIIDNQIYYNNIFDYSNDDDIIKRIDNNISIGAAFLNSDNILLFGAIFDITDNSLHVREVAGNFLKYYKYLDIFSQGLAKFYNKKLVTVKSNKRAVIRKIRKLSYLQNEYSEYFKAV